MEIGVHGIAMAFFPLGIEWLEVAVDKIKSGDDTADFSFAIDWLMKATKMVHLVYRFAPKLLNILYLKINLKQALALHEMFAQL